MTPPIKRNDIHQTQPEPRTRRARDTGPQRSPTRRATPGPDRHAAAGAVRARLGARRRHPGGVRDDRPTRGSPPRTAGTVAGAVGDHRPGPDRDGRRQRRRRRRDLLAGRAELRHEPAVGAAAARAGADRQPGDGRPARRGHRRRSRPADQRALRPVLGLVLRRRPVPVELPHDRHRVHRRQPRARLPRRLGVHRRSDRRSGAGRDHRHRQLPLVGALDVRVRVRELPRHPAVLDGPPQRVQHRPRLPHPRYPRRGELGLGAADHRDGRHHRRAVAAVLPTVQHHRQADHAQVDQLRARSTPGSAPSSS